VTLNVLDRLKRLPGTTNVQIFGAKDYAMRIWLKPDRLAQFKLTPGDVAAAINEQNAQFAAGKIGQSPIGAGQDLVYTITSKGRLADAAQFEAIIVRANADGSMIRLADYEFNGRYNGKPATLVGIFLSPGANALDVAESVTQTVDELQQQFPDGLSYAIPYDTTRFVRVTDAGARFAEDCRRILADIDEAETAAAGTHATPRGTLSLTAPVMFGQLYVTPILVNYLQRFPDVDAQCLFVDRIVNVVEEGIDVAVRIGELPDSSLHAVRVGRVRRVLVASPGYLKAQGVPQRPADLAAHAIVSASGVNPVSEWRFNDGGQPLVQRIHARLRTTTNESALAAALAGLGIARLLSYQVAAQVHSGALQVVLQDFETAPLPVHVAHHEGRRASQKVRAFVDLAVDSLRAHPGLQ
jgi:DNA-binding transcriptional LysR family regulator